MLLFNLASKISACNICANVTMCYTNLTNLGRLIKEGNHYKKGSHLEPQPWSCDVFNGMLKDKVLYFYHTTFHN